MKISECLDETYLFMARSSSGLQRSLGIMFTVIVTAEITETNSNLQVSGNAKGGVRARQHGTGSRGRRTSNCNDSCGCSKSLVCKGSQKADTGLELGIERRLTRQMSGVRKVEGGERGCRTFGPKSASNGREDGQREHLPPNFVQTTCNQRIVMHNHFLVLLAGQSRASFWKRKLWLVDIMNAWPIGFNLLWDSRRIAWKVH